MQVCAYLPGKCTADSLLLLFWQGYGGQNQGEDSNQSRTALSSSGSGQAVTQQVAKAMYVRQAKAAGAMVSLKDVKTKMSLVVDRVRREKVFFTKNDPQMSINSKTMNKHVWPTLGITGESTKRILFKGVEKLLRNKLSAKRTNVQTSIKKVFMHK